MSLNGLDPLFVEDEKELLRLKQKVKAMELKLKEANKPKTITIAGRTHNVIKKYCSTFNVNIGEWVESVLLAEIENNNCVLDGLDKKEMESELINKWTDENQRQKTLIKSSKIILSKDIKFVGYSYVDNKPIYDFTNIDIVNFKAKYDKELDGVELSIVKKYEVSKQLKTIEEDSLTSHSYDADYIILESTKLEYQTEKKNNNIGLDFETPIVKII